MTIIKNKIFIYLFTRYATYGLQFLLSIVIALRLGPYYLGVYGLFQLILNYFEQINFGIPHSLNVYLVQNKNSRTIQEEYTFNALVLFTYLSFLIFFAYVVIRILDVNIGGTYNITMYMPVIVVTAIVMYYNSVLTMVIRIRNKVNILSLIGSIPVVLNIIVVWFFREERLINVLVWINLFSCVLILGVFYFERVIPRITHECISAAKQKQLLNKGFYLFIYNSCFYFILIAVRTTVSSNYSIEEFGYFTFSFTIANAVLLILGALNTIIFPKTLVMMSTGSLEDKQQSLEKLRVGYITSAHFMIYLAMIFFPLIVYVFPKYAPALNSMNMIALAVLMNTNSYGYTSLLIAQNEEKKASYISLVALSMTIIVSLLLVYVFHVDFSLVVLSVLLAYMVFSYFSYYEGNKLLFGHSEHKDALLHFFPIRLMIPYCSSLMISIKGMEYLIFIPLLLFVMMNYKDLLYLKRLVEKMINNPHIMDV